MKVSILKKIILIFLFKITFASEETEEKKFFKIKTNPNEYILYSLAPNQNKYKFISIQIIFSKIMSTKSCISILKDDKILFETDVTSTRNFIINIEEEIESSLKFNATSPEMYVQYQYINENKDMILPIGKIFDFDLNNNSISLKISPVINNSETKYDLYYLGNNDYEDIYEKFIFSLNNNPIGTITKNITDKFKLNFENIQNNIGYYFIKGNNINELSYTYFYESIFVANKENTYDTKENTYFNINTTSNEHYSFYNIINTNKKNYLSFQIFLSKKVRYSHFILLNEDNDEIFDTDINSHRQFIVDLRNENKKLKIMATSPEMYVQYQYINENKDMILPIGKIFDFDLNNNSISLKISPVINNSETKYDLYYLGNNDYEDIYEKFIFSLNNNPIGTITKNITDKFKLNFENIQNNIGYYFIKGNNINELSYTYFYKNILFKNTYDTKENIFFHVTTTSDEIYSFYNINDINKNNYLNFQIFTKNKNDYSHFVLLNENNDIIINYIINDEKHFQIDIKNQNKKLKIKSNSTEMLIQYQYIKENIEISEIKAKLISTDSKTNDNSINFEIIPIYPYSKTTYELYFSKENITNESFNKLEYSLNNKPISTIIINGIEKITLNFKYNLTSTEEKTEKGYAFIKANNINETNYTYFYELVEASIHYNTNQNNNTNSGNKFFVIIIFVILLLIIIVLFVLRSQGIICKKELSLDIDGNLIND